MFTKKKYARKAHNRKPFRRKSLRRRVILRPPEVIVPDKPTFDAAGSSLYSWIHCMPENTTNTTESGDTKNTTKGVNGGIDNIESTRENTDTNSSGTDPRRGVGSLRERAAQVLAQNADSLCASFLEEAPWSCWRIVWSNIVRYGRDSPFLFRMFYQNFGSQNGFVCHYQNSGHIGRTHGSARSVKKAALSAFLAPTLPSHRMENVFSNISVPEFALFVSALSEAAVVADCSGVRVFTPSQLLVLCSTRNLEALDLSNTDIDDQFLYTLRASMVSKQSRLQIIRICGCPNITEAGLRVLLAEPGAPCLAYIESDVQIRKMGFVHGFSASSKHADSIPGTKWRLVQESDFAIGVVYKFHLANKLLCLSRNIPQFRAPTFIWDFKFFPQVVEGTRISEELAFEAWKSRLSVATTRPAHVPFMYVKDCIKAAPKEDSPSPEPVPELSVFGRASHGVSVEKPKPSSVRKPRTVTTNAKSFFFGS